MAKENTNTSSSVPITDEGVEQLKKFFQNVDSGKNQYLLFAFKYSNHKFSVYTNSKGDKKLNVQGTDCLNVLDYLYVYITQKEKVVGWYPKKVNNVSNDKTGYVNQEVHTIMGYDETGVGSFTGGIYSASVLVLPSQVSRLVSLGVKDSKTLSIPNIYKLANIIREECQYYVYGISPKAYNTKVGTELKYNSNSIKSVMANHCLQSLINKVSPTNKRGTYEIVVDAFCSKSAHEKYLQNIPANLKVLGNDVHFIQKADSLYVAVAAASILARHAQLEHLKLLANELGISSIPIGSQTVHDNFVSKFVAERGADDLHKLVKFNFKNLDKIGLGRLKQ